MEVYYNAEKFNKSLQVSLSNSNWDTVGYMFMGTSELVSGTLSFAFNSIVLASIIMIPKLANTTNVFIASLCLCNIAVALTTTPLGVSSNFSERWIWNRSGCTWYGFMSTFGGLAAISNHTTIAMFRYQRMCKKDSVGNQGAVLWCIIGWMYGFVWALPPALGWSNYGFEGPGTWCSVVWFSDEWATLSYASALMVFCYIAPLGTMLTMYGIISCKMASSTKTSRSSFVRRMRFKRQSKVLKMSVAINIAFIIAWTPYSIVAIIQMAGYKGTVNYWVHGCLTLIAKSSACFTPILYALMSGDFRTQLKKKWNETGKEREENIVLRN